MYLAHQDTVSAYKDIVQLHIVKPWQLRAYSVRSSGESYSTKELELCLAANAASIL
jgi:hypothetical protein